LHEHIATNPAVRRWLALFVQAIATVDVQSRFKFEPHPQAAG